MIQFQPYVAGDVAAIRTAGEGKVPPSVDDLAQSSWAFSALIEGRVRAAGGILKLDPWRGVAWAVFAADLPVRAWPPILEKCEQVLALAALDGVHCIECEVAKDFIGGHRFARRLGFRFCGFTPGRLRDGALFVRYARTTEAAEWPALRVQALLKLTEETFAHSLQLREAA